MAINTQRQRRSATAQQIMGGWDNKALVRTKHIRETVTSREIDGRYFKHSLIKELTHRDMGAIDGDGIRTLEVLHLARYMASVEYVETTLINPALLHIVDLDLPKDVRIGAYKIYVDEGYHALMSVELRESILEQFGLESFPAQTPAPLQRVFDWIESLEEGPRRLAQITAASINETLISANLTQANDPSLVKPVRGSIHSHALDESWHHSYFLQVFPQIWQRWPVEERSVVARHVPWVLSTLLSPDWVAVARDMSFVGVPMQNAQRIAAECYPENLTPADIQRAGRGSLTMLRRAGMSRENSVCARFAELGVAF